MSENSTAVERTIGDESICFAVISAVAEAVDTDPADIEPLYESVDPDALDQLFGGTVGGHRNFDGRVAFTLEGCEVVVRGNGTITVTPPGGIDGDRPADRVG